MTETLLGIHRISYNTLYIWPFDKCFWIDPSYKDAECGNQQVEQGEQCDCGSEEVGTNLEEYMPELHKNY